MIKDAQPDDPQDFSFTTGGGRRTSASSSTTTGTTPTRSPGRGRSRTLRRGPDTRCLRRLPSRDGTGRRRARTDRLRRTSPSSRAELVTCTFTNRKRGASRSTSTRIPTTRRTSLHDDRRELSPSSFDPRRRRQHRQRLFEHDLLHRPACNALLDRPDTGVRVDPGAGDLHERLPHVRHRPCTRTERHLHDRDLQARKIVVMKDARPTAREDFAFTAGGGLSPTSFQLDDDGEEANTLASSRGFVVDPGAGYSVAEGSLAPGRSAGPRSSARTDHPPPTSVRRRGDGHVHLRERIGTYVRPKFATPIRVALVPATTRAPRP